ncbi:MAG: diguanylate cyclase [Woeseiaceae bacterium]
MVNTRDAFEFDDVYTAYLSYAGKFIRARLAFLDMPLAAEELEMIQQQGTLSHIAVPLQNKIIKLLEQEKYNQATHFLINKSIPAQNDVLTQISKIIDYQNIKNQQAVEETQVKLDESILIISIVAFIIFIITLVIAFYVFKKITQTEKQIYFEKELAQTTLHSIADGVITVDKDYLIQSINPTAELLADVKSKDVIGKSILNIYQSESSITRKRINKNLSSQNIKRSLFDFTLTKKDGTKSEVEHTIAPIIDEDKNVLGAVIVLRDVTDMRTMEKRLSYQTSHDALTNLINRREFDVHLKQTIRKSRDGEEVHSLCFLDLDKFKIINDTSGHAAGDEFLKQIASTIKSLLRQTDILARLGGDEFAIILDNCSISK